MNAQKVLNQFQENPNAWQLVDSILENSQNYNTKVRWWQQSLLLSHSTFL